VNLAILLSVTDETEEAVRVGNEALEISELLRLDDLRARALRARGTARARSGDPEGVVDLGASIDLALTNNSPECIWSYFNLAAVHWEGGDLRRAFELHEQARHATARFGDLRAARWLEGELVLEHYHRGDWERAEALADVLLDAADAGERFYSEPLWRIVRGHVYLGRDESALARAERDRAVAITRVARDSQLLLPALAFAARVDCAEQTFCELLDEIDATPTVFVGPWLADFAVAAASTGMVAEAAEVLRDLRSSRWVDAASAMLADRPDRAAAIYREIGSAPDEAYARLRAAELATGAAEPADA
jgi:hypothetical protein